MEVGVKRRRGVLNVPHAFSLKDKLAAKTARVYGDVDVFMRALMRALLPAEECTAWEAGRAERMAEYDKARKG